VPTPVYGMPDQYSFSCCRLTGLPQDIAVAPVYLSCSEGTSGETIGPLRTSTLEPQLLLCRVILGVEEGGGGEGGVCYNEYLYIYIRSL